MKKTSLFGGPPQLEPLVQIDRDAEVLARPRPSCRVDAGRAVEAADSETAVVGKGRQVRGAGRSVGLEPGIALKGRFGLFGLGQPEFNRRDNFDAEGFDAAFGAPASPPATAPAAPGPAASCSLGCSPWRGS